VRLPSSSSPVFCYVTDRASVAHRDLRRAATDHGDQSALPENTALDDALPPLLAPLLESIAAAAAVGVHWIQIREKDLAARDLARLTRAAIARCALHNPGTLNSRPLPPRIPFTHILVNDRLDVAIAEGAGGVHLGENSLPVSDAKRLLRNVATDRQSMEFLAGISCHSLSSAQAAAAAGADYIFFGPIFPTPAKRIHGPAQGLERLAEVCRAVSIPVLAIGGVNAENAVRCLDSGASGIAAIRLFQQPDELQAVASLVRSLTA
jgi:thiamine-phosphate pyrophosphorylase